jgi:hypothetical protein
MRGARSRAGREQADTRVRSMRRMSVRKRCGGRQESGRRRRVPMPGGAANLARWNRALAGARLVGDASGGVHRAACSFMLPPALIVLDWPVVRIVGQSLDFLASCSCVRVFVISAMRGDRPVRVVVQA